MNLVLYDGTSAQYERMQVALGESELALEASLDTLRFGRPPVPPLPALPRPVPVAWHVDIHAGEPNRNNELWFSDGRNGDSWASTTTREYFRTEADALAFYADAIDAFDRSPRPMMHYPNGGRRPFCRSVVVWASGRYPNGRIGCYLPVLTYEEEAANV